MEFLLLCIAAAILPLTLGEFPAHLPRCHLKDNECIEKVAQEYVNKYYTGIPELSFASLDPLHISDFVMKKNSANPINIQTEFRNITLYGLKSTKILSVNGSELGGRWEFDAMIPELIQRGNYTVDGKILILPIVGKGYAEIISKNNYFKYSYDLKPVEKNGKTYATLDHVKLQYDSENVQFRLDNLFNGDKILSDNMNKFINENWKDIFLEIKPSYTKALSLEFKSNFNKFFDKFPFSEIFL